MAGPQVGEWVGGDTRARVLSVATSSGPLTAVPGTDSVSAQWVDESAGVAVTAVGVQSSASPADWSTGRYAIAFSATEADKLNAYAGKTLILEVQIASVALGKQTLRKLYLIRRGWIP